MWRSAHPQIPTPQKSASPSTISHAWPATSSPTLSKSHPTNPPTPSSPTAANALHAPNPFSGEMSSVLHTLAGNGKR